jgi:predicted nucleic-acid-binding Zn-ribbon protein
LPKVKQQRGSKYDKYVGQKIGTRTVTESLPRSLFYVVCSECGHETVQRGIDLEKLWDRDCLKCKIDNRDANATTVYNRVKGNAKKRSISFDITLKDFIEIASKNCFYCNQEPVQGHNFRTRSQPYNGLDRLENSFGYTRENSVSCCPTCNYAKHDLSILEFKAWLTKCYGYFILGEES